MIVAALTQARAACTSRSRSCGRARKPTRSSRWHAATGATLSVAHRNRYHPALPVLQRYLADGTLGPRPRDPGTRQGRSARRWPGSVRARRTPLQHRDAVHRRADCVHGRHPSAGTPGDVARTCTRAMKASASSSATRCTRASTRQRGVPIFYDSKKGRARPRQALACRFSASGASWTSAWTSNRSCTCGRAIRSEPDATPRSVGTADVGGAWACRSRCLSFTGASSDHVAAVEDLLACDPRGARAALRACRPRAKPSR